MWLHAGILFVASAAVALAGYAMSVPHDYPTFWPLAGLALFALLATDRREWPLLIGVTVLAALAVDLLYHKGILLAVGTELASAAESWLGATLIRRATGERPHLYSIRQVVSFVGFGALLAPAVGATLGTLVNVAAGDVVSWPVFWAVWWIADAAGVIVVAPPLLTGIAWIRAFRDQSRTDRRKSWSMFAAGTALAALFAVAAWYIFTSAGDAVHYEFLLIVGVVAAGAIGGPFAAATGFFAIASSAVAGIAYVAPHSTTVLAERAEAVLQVQSFLLMAGVTSMSLAAAVSDNKMLASHAVEDAERLRTSTQRLERMVQQIISVMGRVVEARDPYTQGHEEGVARLSRLIATEMGMPTEEVEGIEMAALVHDIGKLAVPSEILTKPGKISETEYELIKAHSRAGYDILRDVDFEWPVADIILQHHERMDGSGYPNGISGDEIFMAARVIAVADVIEAMGSHRPYRPALGLDAAMAAIMGDAERFDPDVVAACVRLHERGAITL